jgi:hypothetical protein
MWSLPTTQAKKSPSGAGPTSIGIRRPALVIAQKIKAPHDLHSLATPGRPLISRTMLHSNAMGGGVPQFPDR